MRVRTARSVGIYGVGKMWWWDRDEVLDVGVEG